MFSINKAADTGVKMYVLQFNHCIQRDGYRQKKTDKDRHFGTHLLQLHL